MASKNLVLAFGNDILCDDAVGLHCARQLRSLFTETELDVVESSEAGLVLMEYLEGYENALLIDAIRTEKVKPGTLLHFTRDDFRKVIAPSPHYAGLPEVFATAERLDLKMPSEIAVVAMEVENPFDFGEELTPVVQAALPEFVAACEKIIRKWL